MTEERNHISAESEDATGWIIEKDDPPVYHLISSDYDEHWTSDVDKALRFARKEDADAYVDHMGWTSPPVRTAEHMWVAPRVVRWDKPVAGAIARGLAKRLPAYADPNFKYNEATGSYHRIPDPAQPVGMTWPKALNVTRHADNSWHGDISFARFPTDDELTALHEFLRVNHEGAAQPPAAPVEMDTNASPASRATATATAIVGEDRVSMEAQPAKVASPEAGLPPSSAGTTHDLSCAADFLDDIEVDENGKCEWTAVANAQTHIRAALRCWSATEPQRSADTDTSALVNRLLSPPVTQKTAQEAVHIIMDLERRIRAQPQRGQD